MRHERKQAADMDCADDLAVTFLAELCQYADTIGRANVRFYVHRLAIHARRILDASGTDADKLVAMRALFDNVTVDCEADPAATGELFDRAA